MKPLLQTTIKVTSVWFSLVGSDLVYLGGRHRSASSSKPPLAPTASVRDTSPAWGSSPKPATATDNRSASAPSRRQSPLAIRSTGASATVEQPNNPRSRRSMVSNRPTSPRGPSVSQARQSLDPSDMQSRTHQQHSSEAPLSAIVGVCESNECIVRKFGQSTWVG